MSKTYEEIKGQFTALAKTSEYIKNRINIIQRFLNEKETKIMAFIGSGSSYALAKSCEHIYRNLTGKPAVSLASCIRERGVIVAITRSATLNFKAIDAISAKRCSCGCSRGRRLVTSRCRCLGPYESIYRR